MKGKDSNIIIFVVSIALLAVLYKFVFNKENEHEAEKKKRYKQTGGRIDTEFERQLRMKFDKQYDKENMPKGRLSKAERMAYEKEREKEWKLYLNEYKKTGTYPSDVTSTKNISTSGTRGLRNNNVGNIRINKYNKWLGKVPEIDNTDGTFEQFTEKKYGDRALLKLLINYKKIHGLDSISKIISRFAPKNENETERYIYFVSNHTGINPDKPLKLNKTELRKLAKAIARFENGIEALTDSEFETAYKLI